MNRRSLLGLILGAPVAASAAKPAQVAATTLAEAPPKFILGQIMDTLETALDLYRNNANPMTDTRVVRKIYDGEKFVYLDSFEGGQVINRVLTQGVSNKAEC
jgi:hypothetical protein